MARKTNIRSIRLSDEMIKMIEQQEGRTFTEKFEGLIIECVWKLTKKQQELQQIQHRIDQERQRFAELEKKRRTLQAAMDQMEQVLLHCIYNLEQM